MGIMDSINKTVDVELQTEIDSKQITYDIIDELILCRRKKNMTQQDIADATGIKRSNIARIESKKMGTTIDTLVRYAEGLGMKVNVFLEEK